MKKTCKNCRYSKTSCGFKTGWEYLYCILDESCFWKGGKRVSPDYVCEYWKLKV
jgi:hypothetical protein